MSINKFNEEVLFQKDDIVRLRGGDIDQLKSAANRNQRQRIRLCTHGDVNDRLHEMFIVHAKDTYVRPHKHLGKMESFHVIEGAVDVLVFDNAGTITSVTGMGDYKSGKPFYHRISTPAFHTLLILSEVLVFHEVTNGPFRSEETVFAPWSPDEADRPGVSEFMANLKQSAKSVSAQQSDHPLPIKESVESS